MSARNTIAPVLPGPKPSPYADRSREELLRLLWERDVELAALRVREETWRERWRSLAAAWRTVQEAAAEEEEL